MRVLITGGAGFVGSSLALRFKEKSPDYDVVVVDNLRRRGSELNLPILADAGVSFFHGDIRNPSDREDLPGEFDVFIEASAEASVQAGLDGNPGFVLDTNLVGTLNCFEFARRRAEHLVFLSTSRVYSIAPLASLRLEETESRFELASEQSISGVSQHGISEEFPTNLPRSLYGATKLASELVLQEYCMTYGLKAVINRCGVIAGAGQFGHAAQGVFTLWVANHCFGRPLKYTGFEGSGKQVRDLLHPWDLFDLIEIQLLRFEPCAGQSFNVGGGRTISTSMREYTALCQEISGNKVPVTGDAETSPVDIPWFVSDCRKVAEATNWKPSRTIRVIVEDIAKWLRANESALRRIVA